MSVSSGQPEKQSVLSQRRYRRVEGIAMPFLPYGLLPVAGLVALLLLGWTVFAFTTVQGTARTSAERALAEAGESWAQVRASGQWITLEGRPPSDEAAQRAINAVRRAKSPTWLGGARPVTRVKTNFTAEQTAQANSITAAPPAAPASPEFLFRLTGGTMTLNGRVPGETLRASLAARAEALKAPPAISRVTNSLEVIDAPLPDGFSAIAERGIDALAQCETGTSSFTDLTFSFRCQAGDDRVEAIRALASSGLPLGAFGRIEVLPIEAIASCEEELSHLLEAARIEFAPGSTVLNVASGPVLDLAARAAGDCPGRLRIEGHTDSTGTAGLNDQLSLRRAEAVRAAMIERGVPAERLIAAGFGQARPVGDNATEEGRARNRRIEIRIVRPDE